jgi:hypothetical protein
MFIGWSEREIIDEKLAKQPGKGQSQLSNEIYLVGATSPTGLVQIMFRSKATPSTVATN